MLLWVMCVVGGLFFLHYELDSHPHAPPPVEARQLRGEDPRATSPTTKPSTTKAASPTTPPAAKLAGWRQYRFEDNSKRPIPNPEETETPSEVADVLPGADKSHMHGRLGLRADGTCCRVEVEPINGRMTDEERKDANRGFCFNSRASAAIPVDRVQDDMRTAGCKRRHEGFPKDLPDASVVMVFHNEHFHTLLRSVHSVLNHSPPHLLREIILLDDVSMYDDERFYKKHWDRLQDELTEYCKLLPKVRLVRLKVRRGLMLARMEGAWRAKGWMTIFLDSHIEATPGWIEPLLARVAEDPKRVVVPSIDGLGSENMQYSLGGGLGVLSFSWTLGQKPLARDHSDNPARSPVMAGGLFGGNTEYFLYLGGYDPEMKLYGGEEMEIGFRTWQCGGMIEHIPCSHVGHIFRTSRYWQGQVYRVPGEEITRNKLRAAEIWMDEYKDLVKLASAKLPNTMSIEPLGDRRQLREKLQCKNFKWFLENVATDVNAPSLQGVAFSGALRNKETNGCIDTLGEAHRNGLLGAYPCHGLHGTQALMLDAEGHIRIAVSSWEDCAGTGHDAGGHVIIVGCNAPKEKAQWSFDASSGKVSPSASSKDCLTMVREQSDKSPLAVKLKECSEPLSSSQIWDWMQ